MMRHRINRRTDALVASLAVALVVAACGGGSYSSSGAKPSASSKPAASSTTALTIGTAKGSMGTYLTGSSGRAIYLWVADHNGKSVCSGACAQNWPPVTASSLPKAAGGVNAADLGMITRSGSAEQITYKGHPLYYFIGDPSSGTTSGEGSDAFGAKWWLVTPAGVALANASGPASASTGNSSTSSPGGSSNSWG